MNQTASITSITGQLNVVDLIVFINYLLNRQKIEIKGNIEIKSTITIKGNITTIKGNMTIKVIVSMFSRSD